MPLETVKLNKRSNMEKSISNNFDPLTGDGGGVVEGGQEVRVHVDHEIFIGLQLLIPGHDSLAHPLRKVLAHHGVYHVNDELLGQLGYLLVHREVLHHLWYSLGLANDVFLGESLVLWHWEVPHAIIPDLRGRLEWNR